MKVYVVIQHLDVWNTKICGVFLRKKSAQRFCDGLSMYIEEVPFLWK